MEPVKLCGTCGHTKALGDFRANADRPDGHEAQCRDCRNSRRRERSAYRTTGADDVQAPTRDTLRVRPQVETLGQLEEHNLRRQLRESEARNRELVEQLATVKDVANLLQKAREMRIDPIRPRERKQGKKREATALAMASDWHVEQRVDPLAVDDRNRYDLTISRRRMERFWEATRYCVNFNREIFTVRDLVVDFGGDFITNYLRDENQQTNLLTPTGAIAYWKTHAKAGIKHLLEDDKLERIAIPCVDGNHPRLTKKMQAANRTQMNLETLMYLQLAEEFADEPRVQFQVATGPELYFDVYGRTVRSRHGDTVHSQGGVGGITIPLLRALARWDSVRRADLTLVHHFHQLINMPNIIVNGSLIGYDEYAIASGFPFEPPAQAFCMLDTLRFKGIFMPMWVGERDDDRLTRGVA
jgi:hypothetical protein